jgi:hypothetical protein
VLERGRILFIYIIHLIQSQIVAVGLKDVWEVVAILFLKTDLLYKLWSNHWAFTVQSEYGNRSIRDTCQCSDCR